METHPFVWALVIFGFYNGLCLGQKGENVALNRTATQSTTEGDWTADRAVDGCTDQTTGSTCCSRTQATQDNEWSVDLGTTLTIGKMTIYGLIGAQDELAGFEIYQGSVFKILAYQNADKPYSDMMEIYPDPPVQTSMLTVRLRSDTDNVTLTICEFEVFEVCSAGFYGEMCTSTCGNCLNNATCYGNTGRCPAGCEAGWSGDNCKTACVSPTYGPDCSLTCNCTTSCDPVTGLCQVPGGNTGWQVTVSTSMILMSLILCQIVVDKVLNN